jgi:hypothetical protein
MLENNSAKESSIYKLVLDLHNIIFAGWLLKYANNGACRIRGEAEWWERAGFLSEKEPKFNSEESRKSQL